MANLQALFAELTKALQAQDTAQILEINAQIAKLEKEKVAAVEKAEHSKKEAITKESTAELSNFDWPAMLKGGKISARIVRSKESNLLDVITCSFVNESLATLIFKALKVEKIESLTTVNSVTLEINHSDSEANVVNFHTKGRASGNGGESNGRKGYQDASGNELALAAAFKVVATAENQTEFDNKKDNTAKWAYMTKVVKASKQFTKLS